MSSVHKNMRYARDHGADEHSIALAAVIAEPISQIALELRRDSASYLELERRMNVLESNMMNLSSELRKELQRSEKTLWRRVVEALGV